MQYGPVQFGLVAMNSPGLTYRQACTYYPVTCDAAKVVQWLKEMRLVATFLFTNVNFLVGSDLKPLGRFKTVWPILKPFGML